MLRRPVVALVVLAQLALTAVGLVVGASPASAGTVHVKAPRLAGPRPVGNEVITLSGNLGRSVTRPVRLQRPWGGRWHTVARGTAGPKGHYAFRIAMPGPTIRWRVTAPPVRKHGKRYERRLSRVRTVYGAIQTAYASAPRSVKVGTSTPVSLAFAPARPGRGALLQVDEGSGWRTVARLTQNSAGRAAATYRASATGTVRLRTVAMAFHGAPQLVGPAVPLAVLRTAPVGVAAHRGASLRNPENTVPAIKNAVKLGADAIELDVHRIAPDTIVDPDGTTSTKEHFVLLHDDSFKRTTNVEQVFPQRQDDLPGTFTWAEVQRLDAGSWKAPLFAGVRVPDLATALDAVDAAEAQYGRKVRVVLEFKGSSPAVMAALYEQVRELRPGWISATRHDDKAVFMAFGYHTVFDTVRQQHPLDGAELAGVMDGSSDPVDDWLAQMHVHSSLASPATVGTVHRTVPEVAVWTVNSVDSILSAATAGADLVTTDDIETARSVLRR